MDVRHLMDANENLKTEIWDLRETASNLDLEKEEIVLENQSLKEQNRILEDKIDCYKAMVEDYGREEEELQGILSQLEETITSLASQNQTLEETKQQLRTEIQKVSGQADSFQDYKKIQEEDLSRMKQALENIAVYFRSLESKIEITKWLYEEEKTEVSELTHTLRELEQIQEVQENEMASLRGQLEEASLLKFQTEEDAKAPSLLHEMVQAKLMQDSLAMHSTIFLVLSKLLWFLLVAIICAGVMSLSLKFYVFVFGKDLETGNWLLWVFDSSFQLLLEAFCPCRKTRGLLPY